jgi:hypothetical protein
MKKVNIKDVEPQLAQKLDGPWKNILQELNYPVPNGYRVRVRLCNAKGRKKSSNGSFDKWSPVSSERAEIWLEPAPSQKPAPRLETAPRSDDPGDTSVTPRETSETTKTNAFVHPAEAELLKALERAESTPGWNFVSLKKFRDEILPLENLPSLRTDVERQNAIRSAIDKRLILTRPVPNPKSPQFPVTSIRLNRLMPEVQEALGAAKADLNFHPIHIKGEPLSTTILRERR